MRLLPAPVSPRLCAALPTAHSLRPQVSPAHTGSGDLPVEPTDPVKRPAPNGKSFAVFARRIRGMTRGSRYSSLTPMRAATFRRLFAVGLICVVVACATRQSNQFAARPDAGIGEARRQADIAETTRRLNEIILLSIPSRLGTLKEAAAYFETESALRAPDGQGVRITVDDDLTRVSIKLPAGLEKGTQARAQALALKWLKRGVAAEETPPPPPEPSPGTGVRRTVVALRNVPLIEAVRYITTLSETRYTIEPTGVVIHVYPAEVEIGCLQFTADEWKILVNASRPDDPGTPSRLLEKLFTGALPYAEAVSEARLILCVTQDHDGCGVFNYWVREVRRKPDTE